MRRNSRKSVYQAGYSTEPGHMETTGVFSPNVESTRIGNIYNIFFQKSQDDSLFKA